MPLSMMKKLEELTVKPAKTRLSLVDRSVTYPYGVIEDIIVKVDKFIFPSGFCDTRHGGRPRMLASPRTTILRNKTSNDRHGI